MKKAVLRGEPPPCFKRSFQDVDNPSKAAEAFVRGLLQRVSGSRPNIEQALTLPFVADISAAVATDGLAPIIKRARECLHQFEKPKNPTVQTSLDELLRRLQEKGNERGFWRSFSEPFSKGAMDAFM